MIGAFGSARLGRDAELRYTNNGDAVCNLSLAFSYGRKDESGQRPTTWVDASLWGPRAEALAQYLVKGSQIGVLLEDVHIETFEGRNGPGHKLAARVVDIDLLGGAPSTSREDEYEAPAPRQRPVQRAAAPAQAPRRPLPAAGRVAPAPRVPAAPPSYVDGANGGFSDDDDIPF